MGHGGSPALTGSKRGYGYFGGCASQWPVLDVVGVAHIQEPPPQEDVDREPQREDLGQIRL